MRLVFQLDLPKLWQLEKVIGMPLPHLELQFLDMKMPTLYKKINGSIKEPEDGQPITE